MSYKYDVKDTKNLVKEGNYEAIIERVEVKTTPNGKNKLSVAFRIRDDVEQPYGNKWMFKDIWEERENPGVFNRKQINQLLGTQEIEDGREFASIREIIGFLEGAALIIHVGVEFDNYMGEDVNTVSYFKKSKAKSSTTTSRSEGGRKRALDPMRSGRPIGEKKKAAGGFWTRSLSKPKRKSRFYIP